MLSRSCAAVTCLSWWRCRQPGWCPGCPAAPSLSYRPGPSWLPFWTWWKPRCLSRAQAGRIISWRSLRGCWGPWWSRMIPSEGQSVCRAAWIMQHMAPCCCTKSHPGSPVEAPGTTSYHADARAHLFYFINFVLFCVCVPARVRARV